MYNGTLSTHPVSSSPMHDSNSYGISIGTFVPFPSIPISLTCIPEAKSALAHRRFSEVERRTKAEQIRDKLERRYLQPI